jgi:hypothetical protein
MKTTISIAVLILLVVNISYVFAGECLAYPNTTSFAITTRTSKCPHYMADTCCKADFVEGQCVRNDGCRRVPDPCSGYLDLISCALECRPDMDLFFDDSGSLTVCSGFYDRVWAACKDSKYCPDEDTDCFTNNDQCLTTYENDTMVWRLSVSNYVLPSAVRYEGDGVCFNTAASLFNRQNVVFGLLAMAVATLMF